MKVVTIASPKGGVGKSTITALLSVAASASGHRVAIIDLNDDQANLTLWWTLRGEPKNPYLVREIENVSDDLAVLAKSGFAYVFIDTPPLHVDLIDLAVSNSDAVIIPGKPSIFDLSAIEPLIEICKRRRKPHAIVLSDVDTAFKKLNASAMPAFAELARVCEARITHRSAYANALTNGQTGPEIDKSLDVEVQALWAEVKSLLAGTPAKTNTLAREAAHERV